MNELHFIIFCIIALLILSLLLRFAMFLEIKMTKIRHGIFGYSIFYTDQKEDRREGIIYSKILTSEKHQIQGKPDYIYANFKKNKMIPVEIKSGTIKNGEPHRGDLFQLLSYFLIIEEVYGAKVKQGRLIYKNTMFIVKNTYSLRKQLLSEIDKMRDMLETEKISTRFEPSFAKCKHCICKNTVCERN